MIDCKQVFFACFVYRHVVFLGNIQGDYCEGGSSVWYRIEAERLTPSHWADHHLDPGSRFAFRGPGNGVASLGTFVFLRRFSVASWL